MVSTRRKFIVSCSALATSAAALPLSSIFAGCCLRELATGEIRFETFAAQVNSQFVARNAAGVPQSLKLVEATSRDSASGEHFSLLFRGDGHEPLDQETYSFEHARLGRIEIFIVPIGRSTANHCYYEAVFNRLS